MTYHHVADLVNDQVKGRLAVRGRALALAPDRASTTRP
ncbi:hypothetical protein QFZ43_003093 [Streptomyces afghaniensis]|nr:hypothetical protein [Streptomyces afghaniensis]